MKYPETARRLREAMSDNGIIAQELADKSEVKKASISQYINGSHKPSNQSSGAMAQILNVSPLWLMGFDVPKELDAERFSAFAQHYNAKNFPETRKMRDDENNLLNIYNALTDERRKMLVGVASDMLTAQGGSIHANTYVPSMAAAHEHIDNSHTHDDIANDVSIIASQKEEDWK